MDQHQAATKIQAIWRGYWTRKYNGLAYCLNCNTQDCIMNMNIFDGKDLCDICFRDEWAEEEYRYSNCYCRDSYCSGGCGVLRCGCIDVCRCRSSRYD